MQISVFFRGQTFRANLAEGIDLSIPLRDGFDNPNCFWAPLPAFSPVVAGDFVGSTAQGGPVNFFNVHFNPHGNGTHTECVGHIAREPYVLPDCLRGSFFTAQIVSVFPRKTEAGDRVVFADQLREVFPEPGVQALIVRTLPNDALKQQTQYSGANPPYLDAEAAQYLAECGVEHLLIDLPSVDREEDGGLLLAHKAFWQYPENPRRHCTITELVYVPEEAPDGLYALNLQTAHFVLDASPSRPVVFPLFV